MKRLSGWDTYVQEATKEGDRSIELPLTPDENYVIRYPTRRQGREIAKAQLEGDTDKLLVALLGDAAGTRIRDLAEDQPAYVLDEFLLDVMRKFGMIPEKAEKDSEDEDSTEEAEESAPSSTNGHVNGQAKAGKSAPKSRTRSAT